MIDYSTFTLDNGLRVVHNYDPSTAMVAVNTLYNVGSRDEDPDLTGLAHLFEHLMFGGSANIPDFDEEMERAGGFNNATTSNDFTNFYDVAPAVNLDTLLWLESDRMLALALTEKSLEVQRSVVIEEFKQTHLNRPYGDVAHRLREMLYKSHPYSWPTIGKEISHIEKATMQDVETFFYTHYGPNNAVLAISGNVTLERAREAVAKWYGDIPRRDIAPRLYMPEAEVTAPRRTVTMADVPNAKIIIAYPMMAHGQPGYIEADLLTDILASGNASRFFQRVLLGNPLLTEAEASIIGSEEPGFLMLQATLAEGMEGRVAEAEELLTAEAYRLRHISSADHPDGITPAEVTRAINRWVSEYEFSMMSCASRAEALAMCVMRGEDINAVADTYRRQSAATLAEAARVIFDPRKACTLLYLPRPQN